MSYNGYLIFKIIMKTFDSCYINRHLCLAKDALFNYIKTVSFIIIIVIYKITTKLHIYIVLPNLKL